MNNFKDKAAIAFIPGWLDSGRRHGYRNCLDIWHRQIDLEERWPFDFVITHSLGALAALKNWQIHRNYKIIMVNPVLTKQGILRRWLRTMILEGTPCPWRRWLVFLSFGRALMLANRLLGLPAADIISSLPLGTLTVIHGEQDRYLGDISKFLEPLKASRSVVLGIPGAGHNYHPEIDRALDSLFQKAGI